MAIVMPLENVSNIRAIAYSVLHYALAPKRLSSVVMCVNYVNFGACVLDKGSFESHTSSVVKEYAGSPEFR